MQKSLGLNVVTIMLLCFFGLSVDGQSVDELALKYPNAYAVIQKFSQDTHIYLEDGKPKGENKITMEMLILNDKANGIYNKYKIYHGSFNELKDVEAYTKVYRDGNYVKIKVAEIKTQNAPGRSSFYDDVKQTEFDFPSLTRGSVAYVSYTVLEKDAHLFSPYYFAGYLPIVNQKLTVTYPADMNIVFNEKNTSGYDIQGVQENKNRNSKRIYTANNIKPIERYGGMPSYAYYEPHVILRVSSFKNEKGDHENFLSDVKDLYNWDYAFLAGINTSKEEAIQKLADSLTHGISDQKEKAKKIYQWVQKNIKYVAFEDGLEGFIPRQAALVCSRRFGDCKDMSSLLTSLLKAAGLDAYFTWIGTRDIPYTYADVPLTLVDNHMIATVRLNNEWLFLDGTCSTCIFGFPSGFIQNKEAMVGISPTEYKILKVPEVEAEKNQITDSTFISINDKNISGTSSVSYNGYFSSEIAEALHYKDTLNITDYIKTRMGKASNKFILGKYAIGYTGEDKKQVNIKADFEIPDYNKKIGDEMYINMNLEKFFSNASIIDTAKNKVGVENEYKFFIHQYTILNIPEGYKVMELPKDFKINNDELNFKIEYKQVSNKIVCLQQFKQNYLLLPSEKIPQLNKNIKEILLQYKEQLVLQKQ